MLAAGVPDAAREAFRNLYEQLVSGGAVEIPGDELESVTDLRSLEDIRGDVPDELIDRAVIVRLNGGLGTSMGLQAPKSLIEVKPGHTFLDLAARQVLA